MLSKATCRDLPRLFDLYQRVADKMEAGGNKQWHWGLYPNEAVIRSSVEAGDLYIMTDPGDDTLLGAATVNCCFDPEYQDVHWLFGVHPGAFHRLAVDPALQGRGLGRRLIGEVCDLLLTMGCDTLRIDTYDQNEGAKALYSKLFREAGTIRLSAHPETADIYHCYERPLTADCSMLPLPMVPSYRGGSLTPWGGEKLRTVWGKTPTQPNTGECLEVSCIAGLESRDPMGVTLPELLAKYGESFSGRYTEKDFPLLLKLLDTSDALSVQVHPGDAYAAEHEQKLGKTEAWLILDCQPGSELIYGIRPSTTREALAQACADGPAVSGLLRRVQVKPGDVCYIPAGCVHALTGGITLYEIQQSSDVTYRFYDWDRTDKAGNKRPLHIRQALDVADLSFEGDPIPVPQGDCVRVLDQTYFTMDILRPDGTVSLPPIQDFAILTAVTDGMTLTWDGASLVMHKGQTVYLPASCPALQLTGTGEAVMSMPK